MQTSGSRPTILIVEDDVEIRAAMQRSLRGCGCRVLTAADSQEAVEVAARCPLDLVLTEEELPTFASLMESARDDGSLKGLTVVIVNPDAEEGTTYAGALVLGNYDQLKPLLPDSQT
jgi:CheY-like chemotaxis protein